MRFGPRQSFYKMSSGVWRQSIYIFIIHVWLSINLHIDYSCLIINQFTYWLFIFDKSINSRLFFHQFWSICSMEHLLARLPLDSPPVVRRIVQLLYPSLVPLDKEPMELVTRAVTLIDSNPEAARVFYLHCSHHMTLQETGQSHCFIFLKIENNTQEAFRERRHLHVCDLWP